MNPNTYNEAQEMERWRTSDGQSCWMTGEDCAKCGQPLATNGRQVWCTACIEEVE